MRLTKNKVLIVIGPTATGKTDLALDLAKRFNGELVSVDSRQVYQGLDIGTGKFPGNEVEIKIGEGFWEMDGIKVWMLDVVSPKRRYDVSKYSRQARKTIDEIIARDKLPILVGGTGLYLRALVDGLSKSLIPINKKLRGELEKLELLKIQQKLQLLFPTFFESLNNSEMNNKRRLIRHIEKILSQPKEKSKVSSLQDFDILKIGLTANKDNLNKRIDLRVDKRIDLGMIEEVSSLMKDGLSLKRCNELGLEYKIISKFLAEKLTKDEMINLLKTKIHQYAKRQLTWFKKETGVNWFDVENPEAFKDVDKLVARWYNQAV